MAFLENRGQAHDLGHSSDCLLLRIGQVLLTLFLLLLLLLTVGDRLASQLGVFGLDLAFAGNLLLLRVISLEVLGSHLVLEGLDLLELFLLVPELVSQRCLEHALGVGKLDLRVQDGGGLLVLLGAVFCSVFLGLGSALHILINLS